MNFIDHIPGEIADVRPDLVVWQIDTN